MKTEINAQDLLNEYVQNYNQGLIILSRSNPLTSVPKKVNVYIDGSLISLPVDMFNRLFETGQYKIVSRSLRY